MGDVVEMVKGRKEKLREEAGKMIAVGIAKNIDRLMTMQMELDRRIIEGRGLQGRDLIPMRILALRVEIAEVAQEMGDAWKFWKTPRPRNRGRVLEELVDVLHFLLSIGLAIGVNPYEMPYKVYRRMDLIDQFHAMFDMAGIAYVPNQWHWAVSVFLGLADMLGFTWDDIESAYLAKNQVNLARQELTLFAEGSHVSHSVLPGSDEARRMTVTSGRKWLELFPRSGPLGLLERMLLGSSSWRSTISLLTWRALATPAGRSLYRLAPLVPRTGGKGFSSWPTPTAQDGKNATLPESQIGRDTIPGALLSIHAKAWPTPRAFIHKDATADRGKGNLGEKVGGQLNPAWVEALMGFPIGWTEPDGPPLMERISMTGNRPGWPAELKTKCHV